MAWRGGRRVPNSTRPACPPRVPRAKEARKSTRADEHVRHVSPATCSVRSAPRARYAAGHVACRCCIMNALGVCGQVCGKVCGNVWLQVWQVWGWAGGRGGGVRMPPPFMCACVVCVVTVIFHYF